MFLPIGDTPNPRGFLSWVSWLLLAANVLVYLLVSLPLSLMAPDPADPRLRAYVEVIARDLPADVPLERVAASLSSYDLFVFEHGYKPGAPELSDLFFAMFLHGGFAHLAGNMLFLWIYADNVEHRAGRLPFLLLYLLTGVAATLGFSALAGGSMTPMVGASGAISGVLGLYFVMFPRNRVKVAAILPPWFFDVWLVPARIVLGIFLVIDNLLPVLVGAGGGVAYGAHIGGFVAGLGVAVAGERLAWRWPWVDRLPAGAPSADEGAGALEALREALGTGDRRGAVGLVGRLSAAELEALTVRDVLAVARWLDAGGHGVAAARLLKRRLDRERDARAQARLHLALAEAQAALGEPVAAWQHLAAVLDGDPDPETALRARAVLRELGIDPRLVGRYRS